MLEELLVWWCFSTAPQGLLQHNLQSDEGGCQWTAIATALHHRIGPGMEDHG